MEMEGEKGDDGSKKSFEDLSVVLVTQPYILLFLPSSFLLRLNPFLPLLPTSLDIAEEEEGMWDFFKTAALNLIYFFFSLVRLTGKAGLFLSLPLKEKIRRGFQLKVGGEK